MDPNLLVRLLSQMSGEHMNRASGPRDNDIYPDSAETVKISALALLKMMRHARAGVPLEVMGLMLGDFVNETTIVVVDVFAMPQSGTSVTVESVDPAFQAKMMEMLARTARNEKVVGWYHSHPGFGCWLSGVDQQTAQTFEQLHRRAIAVVVDPVQSVKGKVVLEAFRLVQSAQLMSSGQFNPIRQMTSNIGCTSKASTVAIVHGLNSKYYSLVCEYNITAREQQMLLKLNAHSWMDRFAVADTKTASKRSEAALDEMIKFGKLYLKDMVEEINGAVEEKKTDPKAESKEKEAPKNKDKKGKEKEKKIKPEDRSASTTAPQDLDKRKKAVQAFGKLNAKQRLEQVANRAMAENITEQLTAAICFKALQRTDLH